MKLIIFQHLLGKLRMGKLRLIYEYAYFFVAVYKLFLLKKNAMFKFLLLNYDKLQQNLL